MSKSLQLPTGWKKTTLGKVAKFGSGATKPSDISDVNGSEKYPVYGGNGIIGYSSEFNSEGPEIIIGRVGEKCGCVHVSECACWVTDNALRIKDRYADIYHIFFAEALKKARLENFRAKGGQPLVTQTGISGVPIILPPLPEQKAIADLLSTWDEAIEKTERLIQAKERQKLGELHSRISSHKANSIIGAFAKPVVRKVDKPEESYVAVGIRSHFKGTFQRLVEDPRTVNMDSLYRVKENDLILNITFAWEGAIALVKKEDEECYVSHRFPTYEIKRSKAEPCFIRQLIMSSRMKYDLSNISPGGAGRNRVLNKKDFLKMPIWLPDLEAQKNIGAYLGAIDNEIVLLKQLADKYKTQKRGLMQKMLTGEWRVKPEIVNQYREA